MLRVLPAMEPVALGVTVLLLLCFPGCLAARDAWREGGRDNISFKGGWSDDETATLAIRGSDGSVAFPVRVVWNPALAPTREYRRYYVLTADEVRQLSRDPECVEPRDNSEPPLLRLPLFAIKFRNPAAPELGHLVPGGTNVRECSERDLPETLQRGTGLVRNPRRGWGSQPSVVRRSDGRPEIMVINGRSLCLDSGSERRYDLQTPVGKIWQVCLVPIAAVGDIFMAPLYLLYFGFPH